MCWVQLSGTVKYGVHKVDTTFCCEMNSLLVVDNKIREQLKMNHLIILNLQN